ncbi:MAG: 30S ribosomal protein S17 [Alteromonadaceae bacterium]|uniref:30S ribosomal protein S17 n=1 Tax=unclassified Marinobacter TaxID=83889 RepID=UPI000C59AAE8|nr:30S ribosomal protein S17 [Marinobacter sp. BGYM27]MAA65754.1 30S ribosomal protein S17 [Alteromonadaceae bacterium]MBH84046.1 30S ribosomal protein S17 [Alteromonadaceae bacterium]MDG5500855.1 30S ribosomal protein S17 [Marinobacter sp. BGYM27]|tara:strand:- start:17641 stop:17907 length:267 start_codon:yes stop_codon:yes gene_type:complete
MTEATKTARTLSGKVVSNKMEKSIVVLVERQVKHPLYGKYLKRSTKIHAHDENNQCNIGDIVRIEETRPISKTKSWSLVDVVERASKV